MYRAILAAALVFTGASAASAQGYGHYGNGGHGGPSFYRPAPVVVVPHRPPVFVAPGYGYGYGYGHGYRRHHDWRHRGWRHHGWGHGRSW